MKTRRIIQVAFASFCFLFLLTMAQGVRWYKMDKPIVSEETINGDVITFTELTQRYPDQQFDENYKYFRQMNVRHSFGRGMFPFSKTKTDTISSKLTYRIL